jgi:hypothetical protein
MSFNKYFNDIFCINLDQRPDRWDEVQQEFNKFNLTGVTRFSAVDGKTLPKPINTGSGIPPLLPGELGVLESNLKLVKYANENNLPNFLMLEDDVVFSDEVNNLDKYMSNIPDDWDMIYFGGNHKYSHPPKQINETTLKLHYTVAIHCVAIKSTVYDVIESILSKRSKQVDNYYTLVQQSFNVYCTNPSIAFQKEGFSDIQNRVVNYDGFLK